MPKQSAFDVLLRAQLGKRKQNQIPATPALEALQGTLGRTGGSLSPAAPGSKRIKTPRGESSYATCPVCSKTLPRALLEAHTSDCVDARDVGSAAQLASVPEPPNAAAAPAVTQAQSPPPQQDGDKQPSPASDTMQQPASQQPAAGGRPRQSHLDGRGVLAVPPAERSLQAAARPGSGGKGAPPNRQARFGCGATQCQQSSRAGMQPNAAHSSTQMPNGEPVAQAGRADETTAAAPAAQPAGNAFATMMQCSRQLAQVRVAVRAACNWSHVACI